MPESQWPLFFLLLIYWTGIAGDFVQSEILDIQQKHPLQAERRTSTATPTLLLTVPYSDFLCGYLMWFSFASSLYPLSIRLLSGPTWPENRSVSYRSWRVRPSPQNTDWLAGLISSLRTLCSLSSSAGGCAARSWPDRKESSCGANMNPEQTNKLKSR